MEILIEACFIKDSFQERVIIMEIPVKLGQEIELTINGYGHEGEGVSRHQQFTIFVSEALKDETVLAKVVEIKRNFARAEILSITKPAPDRVTPHCNVSKNCGGCQFQHLDYRAQLITKQQRVSDAMERIGGLHGVTVHSTMGMKEPWRYRNKVQCPVGMAGGAVVIGFYRKGTHQIVPMSDCMLQPVITNKISRRVRDLVEKYRVSIYNERTGGGMLRHVLIKYGFATNEAMIVLVTNGDNFPDGSKIARDLIGAFPEIKSVVQNINRSRDNVILGNVNRVLWGKDSITEKIGSLQFKISANSFFQVNPVQLQVLYSKTVEYAALSWKELVLDAYCGVGSLTLFLAKKAKQVYGIESVAEAIFNARENAKLNGVENVEFLTGTVEKVLPNLLKRKLILDVAVLDPPRSGCEEVVLKTLAESKVKRIVYVSCNPGTLARDLKILDDLGYKTYEIQPVDMFPHTYHVECVVRVERKHSS
jgi:23S rRNA (uracil1939-C5)-methyltransferase